ncbi:MAG: pyridoxal-phosphate dependent enzyme [Aquificales bacterium]|nr:pyridoxal-phosphate dependent enzyme [Aquificales bacterium]
MQLRLPKILQTQQAIQPHIRQTPLIRSPCLSQKSGADVWLKLENWQPTGSFKIRGALSKLSRLNPAQREQGIVAASAGNHALGVAYAAEKLGGFRADIFVPGTAPKAKIDEIILSSETAMRHAIFTLLNRHQLVVEASGAIAITPLLSNTIDLTGLTVVCVLSGGNLETAVLRNILEEFK